MGHERRRRLVDEFESQLVFVGARRNAAEERPRAVFVEPVGRLVGDGGLGLRLTRRVFRLAEDAEFERAPDRLDGGLGQQRVVLLPFRREYRYDITDPGASFRASAPEEKETACCLSSRERTAQSS